MSKDDIVRILLAEDSEADHNLVRTALKETGLVCDLKWVQDGEKLMDYLLNRNTYQDRREFPKPDLIFLDLRMPHKGGQEAFLEIMSNVELRRIPVIFLTSLMDQDTAVDLMKCGATDYLSKTRLTPDALWRSIRYSMELKRREDLRIFAENVAIRFGRVLDNATNEIYIFTADTHRIIQANRGARRHLGYTNEEILNLRPLAFMPDISEERFAEILRPLLTGESSEITFETVQQRKNGTRYAVEVQFQISRLEAPPVFFAIVQDLSERRQSEAKLERAAYYDALTELPNRGLFKERLVHTLAQANRTNQLPVVACLDLDRFKVVMETFGSAVCEMVIKAAADRLKDCLREGDTVARISGDEFMLLLPGSANVTDVSKIAARLLGVFQRPFHVNDNELHLTASIGITVYPEDGKDAEILMKHASTAMYRAKEQGRNNYQLFNTTMNAQAFGRMAMENSLRHALERNEFTLCFQPVIDLKTGRTVAAEALIRWKHPEMGLVFPNDFIPMAEESGLIIPIGEWVLRTACSQAKLWHNIGVPPIAVSVNISVQQIKRKEFFETVEQVLKDTGLAPEYLILEVTENVFMESHESTREAMAKLKKMGIRIAIDDFGTGFSSLGYLKEFSVGILKIDQSFMRNLTKDSDYASIVESIIRLAHNLRLHVVAEGVETIEQLEAVRKYGCDEIQGFYISQPVSADDLTKLILNQKSFQLRKAS